ncbi:MAG TPA: CARDB domain-containing protein [Gaiellaceae bacterium]|nr:CARDB domain-containing protein [Gaiellaceae bacterium]
MSEYDSDIEFDFFDDLETGEPPPSTERPRGQRPPGPPRRPERPQIPPTARLAGLIAFGILVIVLLVLWVQSCSGTSKKSSFESYFGKVSALAADSNRLGKQFSIALTTPGITGTELASKLDTLGRQQQVDLQAADRITPPNELRGAHGAVAEALALRVSGLSGIADVLRTDSGSSDVSSTAVKLAGQAQRLVASDVIWTDLFRTRALSAMQQQGITGLAPPSSSFLSDSGVDSQQFWTPVVERLNQASTTPPAGAKIGTALVAVKTLAGKQLVAGGTLNTVQTGTNFGFVATVQNSGDYQLVRINVTLTIQVPGAPITQTQVIPVINKGETKDVTFRGITLSASAFAKTITVRVDVQPVKNETNSTNNSASYKVLFSA